jgi:succinyl-CoA synthetase beta subunit
VGGDSAVARVLETVGKEHLRSHGVATPSGNVASTAQEAAAVAHRLGGGVVVKALVPSNRRAKAGGVRFATTPEVAEQHAADLLGMRIDGHLVESLLIEERLEIESELYLAVTLDKSRKSIVALASAEGGVDVEDALAAERLASQEIDPWGRVFAHDLRGLWRAAGASPELVGALVEPTRRIVAASLAADATLLEVNPLAVVNRSAAPVAVGALLELDDAALARQPLLAPVAKHVTGRWRPPTVLELEALAAASVEPHRGTARFVELEGDVGLLSGGGGGSLVAFDAVRRAGGRPSCYTELGGNPSAEKVRSLTRVVLRTTGVRGLLVSHNITNNTQVDLVAEGVVAALDEAELDPQAFPVVAREIGTHDAEGRAMFERSGIEYLGEDVSIEDAARLIVRRIREAAAA